MILVLAGTQDGREIVQKLLAAKYPVVVSVVSEYGKKLLEADQLQINDRPLPGAALGEFMKENQISTIIDATHPYAAQISQTAMRAARDLAITYIRYERQAVKVPAAAALFIVPDYPTAAQTAADLGKTIFLTTGSRNLRAFVESPCVKSHTIIARVLPDAAVLMECSRLGLLPKQLIAMQGPFSHELNRELYQKYQADVIVTKNSGKIGGTDTKLSAAIELGLPVVMIDRPIVAYPAVAVSYDEIIQLLNDKGETTWIL